MTDYIKREDAVGIVKNLKRFSCFGDDGFVEIPMVYCELMQVASADVAQVRHGRWALDTEHTEEIYAHPVKCSVCGRTEVLGYETLTPYCPNCGAKMDGGED